MAKIYIETNGCSHNFSDSEHMAGILKKNGHQLVNSEKKADIILFNTCTVKTPTEHAFLNRLKKVEKNNKKIIIAGCIPQSNSKKFKEYALIGTKQIGKINIVIDSILKGQKLQLIKRNEKINLLLPRIRKNPLIEIVTISTGCLSNCSFCKTKQARGQLESYSLKEIIQKVRIALNEGVKEIWLTSQDTACYGFDIKTTLPKLLNELNKIDKEFKIRIGMGNPDHFLKIIDSLIKEMKSEKIYNFLHIPLQSGNNEILRNMKRKYTMKQYKDLIKKIKEKIPSMTIATDIIVGFPGETKKQFKDTVEIIKSIKPDVVNISRFWAREQTLAAKRKDQLPQKEIMARSKILSKLCKGISLKNKKQLIGKKFLTIINEKGKLKNQWKARTGSYKQITLKGNFKIGDKTKTEIIKVTAHDLIGKIIK